ncbi:hypothetical protein H650_17005 [Enterobacter sp. R4-368]|nr:hypothetical protein H650_17005 [Enterobacter sp. R4-368]
MIFSCVNIFLKRVVIAKDSRLQGNIFFPIMGFFSNILITLL